MDRLLPTLVILIVLAIVFAGVLLGWRARRRRQAGLPPLPSPPGDAGQPRYSDEVLYVATTTADEPTDRIAVRGLGFRSRARVAVTPAGVILSLAGQPDALIPTSDLLGAGRATWTIDRVVGRDGLAFVRWNLGGTSVDSYFRAADPAALVAAIEALTPSDRSSTA